MIGRQRVIEALKGRSLTVRGLADELDVDNLTSLAAMCQNMTERGVLTRAMNGRDPGGRRAVYLYSLASSPAAPVDPSGTESQGCEKPPRQDTQGPAAPITVSIDSYTGFDIQKFQEDARKRMAADDTQVGGDHYTTKAVQPWTAMQAWMPPEQFAGFLRGNAIKYLARCDDKGGVEDLKKARHYLDKLIEFLDRAQ
jgi:hypothetical protein